MSISLCSFRLSFVVLCCVLHITHITLCCINYAWSMTWNIVRDRHRRHCGVSIYLPLAVTLFMRYAFVISTVFIFPSFLVYFETCTSTTQIGAGGKWKESRDTSTRSLAWQQACRLTKDIFFSAFTVFFSVLFASIEQVTDCELRQAQRLLAKIRRFESKRNRWKTKKQMQENWRNIIICEMLAESLSLRLPTGAFANSNSCEYVKQRHATCAMQ